MKTGYFKSKYFLYFLLTLLCLSLIIALVVTGQQKLKERKSHKEIEHDVSALVDESQLIGSMALVRKGKIVYTDSFGYADKDKELENTNQTLYPIASLQKNMTAVIIAQLIREDKLTYETTLEKFYPDLEHGEEITIRDLLNHTSGYVMPEVPAKRVLFSEKDQLENVFSTSEYTGDNAFNYSNGNYSLLAGIISQLDKTSYKESLHQRILTPLNMKNTYLWDEIPEDKLLPKEYYFREDSDYNQADLIYSKELISTLLGAGNLYATVKDLATFEMSLNNDQLLSDEEYEELFYFSDSNEVMMSGNISADGVSGGYSSYLYGDLTNQNFVVFLANQSAEYYPDQLMSQIYKQLLLF